MGQFRLLRDNRIWSWGSRYLLESVAGGWDGGGGNDVAHSDEGGLCYTLRKRVTCLLLRQSSPLNSMTTHTHRERERERERRKHIIFLVDFIINLLSSTYNFFTHCSNFK